MNPNNLQINNNLRTIQKWKKLVYQKEKTKFTNEEKNQLEALERHYRTMIDKNKRPDKATENIEEIQKLKQEINKED